MINGQKVWTSFAQYSTRCVLLTRTGPGHAGITAFFVDMDTPGITVRPLRTMHGVDEFCEVYFDDVVVPADRMLGNPGDGWQLAMDLLPFERSTCFWQRIAYLYARFDALLAEVDEHDGADDAALGAAYLALHTVRCRSRQTQHRLADGARLGADTSIDKVLLATAEQRLYDTARDLLPRGVGTRREPLAHRVPVLARGDDLRRHRRDPAQHHRAPAARSRQGVTVEAPDAESLGFLEDALRKTMLSASGARLDAALVDLGWHDMLDEMPDVAIPLVFRLLGETGAHAPVLNDVVLHAMDRTAGDTVALPYAGGSWVVWERTDEAERRRRSRTAASTGSTPGMPCRWWPLARRSDGGSSAARGPCWHSPAAMRSTGSQFGRPIASFQAVRHRLAETLVAIDGAEATLSRRAMTTSAHCWPRPPPGRPALTAARHCQQVLGGIGFTAEHDLHRHVKRVLVLDGLLGSSRELTREAGRVVRVGRSAPRVATL